MDEAGECCAVCSLKSNRKCANCHLVYYCSKDHQKSDWKSHKEQCHPFQIITNYDVGRHIVATRKIKPYEKIICELPLVTGPMQKTPPVCLGCYKVLSELSAVECGRCGWPLCSTSCPNLKDHAPECEITVNCRKNKVGIKSFGKIHPSYEALTVLRCLHLKSNNLAKWKKIKNLQSDISERKNLQSFEDDKFFVANFIRTFFNVQDFTDDEIMEVLGVININGHENPLHSNRAVSVYNLSSYFEHNCRANCSKSFGPLGEVIVRSALEIQPGEHLSICYTDPLWGIQQRRRHLQLTKYFMCQCERCSDPTEFGTNFNSIKCPQRNCDGYLLMKTKTDQETNWACNICEKSIPRDEVDNFLEMAGDMLLIQDKDLKSCAKFIDEHKAFVHRNHYLLVKARLTLLEKISLEKKLPTGLSYSLEDLQEDSDSLLTLISLLMPAEVRCRGVLAFQKFVLLTMQDNISEENLKKIKVCLKMVCELLKNEAPFLPEGQLALQAQKELNRFGGTIENQ